jgi:DNA helicase-2/ATP-dependent DNA helicase PcrA
MEANDVFGLKKSGTKQPVYTPVTNQRSFSSASTQKASLNYAVGDRVRHIKFGDGEVTAIVEGGKDYEVTVDFDKVGTKKMFAAFAKLKKV